MKNKIFSFVVSLIGIAIVFAIVNLILVGGQNLWNKDEKEKLETIKIELEESKNSIDQQEESLIELDDELAILEEEIDSYEYEFPEGIPEEYYEGYSDLVNDYNDSLYIYEDAYRNYNAKVYRYNETVKEANALAEEVGSTWYVIPFPGR